MRFLTARAAALPPYVPGDHREGGEFLRLNSNESPYPPSPGVLTAVTETVSSLNWYNDPDCGELREAIAARLGLRAENVLPVNGSDQALYLALMAFAGEERSVLLPDVTYGYYDDFAAALGVALEKVPLRADYSIDPADYCRPGKMALFPNPNAPTGLALSPGEIARILEADETRVVVIDEAYVDFGAESVLPLIPRHPNLLITRTFSKSGSLAGARLGYALGQAELIGALASVRSACDLYGVSRMAQAAGAAACREWAYYEANCRRIAKTRDAAMRRLAALGFQGTASLGNFLFVKPPMDAGRLQRRLAERGILVRHWNLDRVRDRLRITVGTEEQMAELCRAAEEILKEETACGVQR